VGSLAYLLKNRFYIGEVVYRGEVHRGEHEPILDRDLFEAVQAKLSSNAVARQVRLKGSPAILTGRIFDDRGNRMSPTHSADVKRFCHQIKRTTFSAHTGLSELFLVAKDRSADA
jgi:hypothetical protein